MSDDLRKEYKEVQLEITTVDSPVVGPIKGVSGWGEHARSVTVSGRAVEIIVRRGDKSEFGIRILEDGSIILTGYNSLLTTELVVHSLRFENERPWE